MTPQSLDEAIVFDCAGEPLVGVLSRPAAATAPATTAMLVVVGGPQTRAGAHRQFVQLARRVAAAGCPVLRFDVRGMGDSGGDRRSFEAIDDDIAAAIAALRAALPAVRRVVLWALCDGASAALLYLDRRGDAGIGGLVLLNPWVRSVQSEARTRVRHYYLRRLAERGFWTKLVRGGVGLGAVAELLRNVATARRAAPADAALPYTGRMARAWQRLQAPLLLLLSGRDDTAREFEDRAGSDPAWAGALQRANVERHDAAGADHTFSGTGEQARLEAATLDWLARIGALPCAVAPPPARADAGARAVAGAP